MRIVIAAFVATFLILALASTLDSTNEDVTADEDVVTGFVLPLEEILTRVTPQPGVSPHTPPRPPCGTVEDRMAQAGVSREMAESMLKACEEAPDPPPLPESELYTFPLTKDAAYVLPNGNEIVLPEGLGIGMILAEPGRFRYLAYGDSKLYFDATTWEPLIDSTVIGSDLDKPELAKILEQLKIGIPEYKHGYEEMLGVHFE